jgi:hypothetical protein
MTDQRRRGGSLERLPHPAIVCSGPQLLKVIEDMEAGDMDLPGQVIWRTDLDGELQVRLARACGGTDDQIAGIRAVLEAEDANRRQPGGRAGAD